MDAWGARTLVAHGSLAELQAWRCDTPLRLRSRPLELREEWACLASVLMQVSTQEDVELRALPVGLIGELYRPPLHLIHHLSVSASNTLYPSNEKGGMFGKMRSVSVPSQVVTAANTNRLL